MKKNLFYVCSEDFSVNEEFADIHEAIGFFFGFVRPAYRTCEFYKEIYKTLRTALRFPFPQNQIRGVGFENFEIGTLDE